MSLEALSSQIEAEAKAEAKAIIRPLNIKPKQYALKQVKAESHMEQALSRLKDAEQISVEVVASVEQNQNAGLIAREAVLDETPAARGCFSIKDEGRIH